MGKLSTFHKRIKEQSVASDDEWMKDFEYDPDLGKEYDSQPSGLKREREEDQEINMDLVEEKIYSYKKM